MLKFCFKSKTEIKHRKGTQKVNKCKCIPLSPQMSLEELFDPYRPPSLKILVK